METSAPHNICGVQFGLVVPNFFILGMMESTAPQEEYSWDTQTSQQQQTQTEHKMSGYLCKCDILKFSFYALYVWVNIIYIYRSYLLKREYNEGSAPTGLYNDGNKFGVNRTEGTVPGDPWHPDVIVALIIFHRLAKNMAELALPDHTPDHL